MHLEPALLGNNEQEQHAPLSLEIEHCWQMSGCLIYYVAADMAVYPYCWKLCTVANGKRRPLIHIFTSFAGVGVEDL